MKKRSEMTSATIITIVLLLIGAAILFFVIARIFTKTDLDRETCHQSVVLRGSLPTDVQNFIPLKCKTGKYCITTELFGTCDEFKTEQATRIKVSSKEGVEKAIVERMYDCWSMMGEGKLSIFSQYWAQYGIGEVYSSCIICGRIALADDVTKKWPVNTFNINNYLLTHKILGSEQTYYQHFAGGNAEIDVDQLFTDNKITTIEISDIKVDDKGKVHVEPGVSTDYDKATQPDMPEKEISITFMQISAPGGWQVFSKTAKSIGGSILLGSFVSKGAVLAIGKAAATGPGIITTAVLSLIGITYQQVNTGWNQAIAAGYCGDVKVGKDELRQCSVVRVTNYDKSALKKYCSVDESIP